MQSSPLTASQPSVITRRYQALLAAGLCLLACLCSPGVKSAGKLEPWAPSTPLPAFSLPDTRGEIHRLADQLGKVVLVNFWASWCPPCIKEIPSLQRLRKQLADRPFEILTVNVGEQRYRVWKFAKLISLDLPVLLDADSQTFTAWEASVLPTSYLLDMQGNVRYRVVADLEWDTPEVITLIDLLLDEGETTGQEGVAGKD